MLKHFLFVLAFVAALSTATSAQVPDKEKVIAGAERAFEKVTKAYVAPAPGCAAAVSLNGVVVFERRLDLPISSTTFRTRRKLFLSRAQ